MKGKWKDRIGKAEGRDRKGNIYGMLWTEKELGIPICLHSLIHQKHGARPKCLSLIWM